MNLYNYQRSRSFIDLGPRSLTFSSFLSLETAWLIEGSQISCRASVGWGMKVTIQMVYVTCPRCPPCPYMVKTLKNLLFWNQKAYDLECWYRVLMYYQVCSNDDPKLTLTYFTARSNLVPYAIVWEKS